MKTHYAIALAMLAGFGLGTVAVQGLHAQAKPPVYQVTEIEILDPEAYSKDYVPKARAAIQAAGAKFLAVGGKTTAIDGEPPKSRIVIQQWDSIEKIKAYRDSAAFKELLPLREKLALFWHGHFATSIHKTIYTRDGRNKRIRKSAIADNQPVCILAERNT